MTHYNPKLSPSQLYEILDSQYFELICETPSDSVEQFINHKLFEMAQKFKSNDLDASLVRKKLDYILGMTKDERYALAISDMQKRSMPIPQKYHHLCLQNKNNPQRDMLFTPSMLRTKILLYGVPYTLFIFLLGIAVGYYLLPN